MKKTHYKKLMNTDYIGAYSLDEGKDMIVTVSSVAKEEVTGDGGKKESLVVAQLKDNKPFIINATNAKSITKVVGSPYIEDWAGKSVTLFVSTTRLGKDMVECLRVRDFAPKVEIDTTEAIKKLNACKDLKGLATAYTALSRAEQGNDDIIALKDVLKAKLK